MAESTIEISSDESDVEDGSNTRSTNIEFQNNAIIKEELHSESSMCKNCSLEFPDIKKHLYNSRACFFPLTERYWKPRGEEQLCKICEENLKDKLKLKNHCFENETCRDMYIQFYIKKIPCSGNKEPKEGHHESLLKRDTELNALPVASGSFSHNQDRETHVRATLVVKHAIASVTNNAKAMSRSAPGTVEAKRTTKRNRSRNLTCGECKDTFTKSDNFLLHAIKKPKCFSHYETENTEVTVSFCFKCKRNFKTCKLCIEHVCVGLVKHQCPQCSKIFPSIQSLINHESTAHERK